MEAMAEKIKMINDRVAAVEPGRILTEQGACCFISNQMEACFSFVANHATVALHILSS